MQIYLLRHGIAESGTAGRTDEERALTAEGREKLRRALKRAAGTQPSLILTSPYRRALETAEIAAEALRYSGELLRTAALVPDASPDEAWEEIRERSYEPSILLASHEPLMSSLAAFLLGCPALAVVMEQATLLRVDCDRFGPHPHGTLRWMITAGVAG